MNWKETIEAQIAFMESMYGPGISGSMKDAALETGERVIRRLLDVAVALEIERNWSPVAADPFGDHEALDCAIRDTDAALDKLREVSDE